MPSGQNNIAKLLFGADQRSSSIKKDRQSADKSMLEQALNSSMNNPKMGARSEDKKPRTGPKVTFLTKAKPAIIPGGLSSVYKSDMMVDE